MLKLMYITNDEKVATIAEKYGVDRIFIDLEINGKQQRQKGLDTVISKHNTEDVGKIRKVLKKSELLVRVNSIYEESEKEIESVIEQGANIIMLPYFKTIKEIKRFLEIINGKAKTCLLLETPEAVDILDDILKLPGIDEIHIGLNDLHLGYKRKFMFELLADGTVDNICNKIKNTDIKYGFGGFGRIGCGDLPAEKIIMEHYRLKSNMAILSRSFCNVNKIDNTEEIEKIFKEGLKEIRKYEQEICQKSNEEYEMNHREVIEKVNKIVEGIK